MKSVIDFIDNHELIICLLWCFMGFLSFWIAELIRQVFYWEKRGQVSIKFGGLENKKDWLSAFAFSIISSTAGIIGIIFIIMVIHNVKSESARLRSIDELGKFLVEKSPDHKLRAGV